MGYVFFSQRTRKSLYPKDLDFSWPQLTSVSTGIFLTKVQTVKKSNSACYSYNFYFYLYIKFYLSCFTFYNVWISKCLYLWHLNKSLIHIKLPANLACFGKSHISLNSLKLVLSTSLSIFKLDNAFFFLVCIHVQNLYFTVQTSFLYFRHSYWDTHKLIYNL